MRSPENAILIVGAGIAGIAAACALARKGYYSVVLEQAAEISDIGAGVQFGPNALRMLRKIGFTDELDRLAIYPDAAVMLDSVTAEEVVRIPYGKPFVERFKAPYALVHRADLLKTLTRAAERSAHVSLRTNCKVEKIAETGAGVTVTTESGESLSGPALIGADGLWSVARQHVVGDGAPRVSGHVTYRAVLREDQMPDEYKRNMMTLWAGDNVHAVNYPLRGGELYNLAATFHSRKYAVGWDDFGDAEELWQSFRGKHPKLLDLIDKIETWRMWVLCDRDPVRKWTEGKVVLIGDAAHPTLQYLGQGAATSIEDGVCLAIELERANGDIRKAAVEYQNKRYLRTARVQMFSRLYGEVYHANDVARELRNAMLPGMVANPYESMAWMYDYDL